MRRKIETKYGANLSYNERKEKLFAMQNKLITYLNYMLEINKISIRGLASQIDYSPSTVLRWIRREFPMEYETSIKICEILNLNIDEYLDIDLSIVDKSSDSVKKDKLSELTNKFSTLTEDSQNEVLKFVDELYINDLTKRFNNLNKENQIKTLQYMESLSLNHEKVLEKKI